MQKSLYIRSLAPHVHNSTKTTTTTVLIRKKNKYPHTHTHTLVHWLNWHITKECGMKMDEKVFPGLKINRFDFFYRNSYTD